MHGVDNRFNGNAEMIVELLVGGRCAKTVPNLSPEQSQISSKTVPKLSENCRTYAKAVLKMYPDCLNTITELSYKCFTDVAKLTKQCLLATIKLYCSLTNVYLYD